MTRRTQRLIIGVIGMLFVAGYNYYVQSHGVIPRSGGVGWTTTSTNLANPPRPDVVGTPRPSGEYTATVARVVDGDTIELDTGEKVRYIGVNTPESVDPRKGVECFGKEASEYNNRLVGGSVVELVGDVGDKDTYGRLLRYVYLDDGTFVNLKLVQDGYASVMTVPPNVAHQSEFVQAQSEARKNKVGLWSACK